MNLIKKYFFFLLLCCGVGGTSWLLLHSHQETHPVAQGETSRPDAFMKDVLAVETDRQGQIVKTLKTPYLVHYNLNDRAELTDPIYTIYQTDEKQPWVITALSGVSLQGGKTILLNDNVNIHEKQGAHNEDILILTSNLTYYPSEQLATTDKHVTIKKPDLLVTATGMNAYLAQKQIDLLSNTRGTYVPEKTTF